MQEILNFLIEKKEYYETLYTTELDSTKATVYFEIITILDDLLDNIYKLCS